MWETVEYSFEPTEFDDKSSSKFVYIRKHIECIKKDENDVYVCQEHCISKENWDMYKKIIGHDTELSEVQDALIELSKIITEA